MPLVVPCVVAGFRVLFSGSEEFATSNVNITSIDFASDTMEATFNPNADGMVGNTSSETRIASNDVCCTNHAL